MNQEVTIIILTYKSKNLTIDYIKPGRLDDLLTVTSELLDSRKASLIFGQNIKNENNELLSKAEVKIACINSKTLKASPMPDKLILELTNDN